MPVNIAELERRARRVLTPEVYDYYAGGSGSERTLRTSAHAWQQHWLMPRVLRDDLAHAMALAGHARSPASRG